MKQKLYIAGVAGTLAVVALIVAFALASSHATAPERIEVSNHAAAAPVAAQSAGTAAPFEQSEPSVCSSPAADPGDCTYQ
jgi:hypothetical protein